MSNSFYEKLINSAYFPESVTIASTDTEESPKAASTPINGFPEAAENIMKIYERLSTPAFLETLSMGTSSFPNSINQ
jgi:hypothetical protein